MGTIKITGIDEGTTQFVQERAKSLHFKGKAEYLRSLIREDMAKAANERKARLESIVAPLQDHADKNGYTDEQLSAVFERARDEVFKAKPRRSS